jgi:AP-1-like transcription factor
VAKHLKEENDRLHVENAQLKEKISTYERELLAQKADENKRCRDNPSADIVDPDPPNKRSRLAVKTTPAFQVPTSTTIALTSSTPSLVSSPDSNVSSENGLSPLPAPSSAQGSATFPPTVSTLDSIFSFPPGPKAPVFGSTHSIEVFECGFCIDGTSCVCREMTLRTPEAPFNAEAAERPDSSVQVALPSAPQIVAPSILDNLPPYLPPVPLRRSPAVRPLRSLFPVVPLSGNPSRATPTTAADCSGDPSNCLACADDVFGQAFCAAVGESLAAGGPCADCPRGTQCADNAPSDASREGSDPAETIPTSDAWRQLKSHPNVSFADLTLLAEVVARRSKCTGPTVVISPPPGSFTPERPSSPAAPKDPPAVGVEHNTVLPSDPHAHYQGKEKERSVGSRPKLAPEEHLRCSRPRSVREVHAAGVREALALLDSRF